MGTRDMVQDQDVELFSELLAEHVGGDTDNEITSKLQGLAKLCRQRHGAGKLTIEFELDPGTTDTPSLSILLKKVSVTEPKRKRLADTYFVKDDAVFSRHAPNQEGIDFPPDNNGKIRRIKED